MCGGCLSVVYTLTRVRGNGDDDDTVTAFGWFVWVGHLEKTALLKTHYQGPSLYTLL